MSWGGVGWAVDRCRTAGRDLPAPLRWLLVLIAERENEDWGYTLISYQKLANYHGNTVDWLKDACRKLEAMGFLARIKRLKVDGSHDFPLFVVLRSAEAYQRALDLGWEPPEQAGEVDDDDGLASASDAADPQDVGEVGVKTPHPPNDGGGGQNTPRVGVKTPHHIRKIPLYCPLDPLKAPVAGGGAAPSPGQPVGMASAGQGPSVAMPGGIDPDPAGADAFLAEWRSVTKLALASDVPERIRRLWRRLDERDRKRAIGDLPAWSAQMRREQRSVGSAIRYLRDRAWQSLDHVKAGRREGAVSSTFFVRQGTPEWGAWERHEARAGRKMMAIPSKHHAGLGWWFPTLWPPRDGGTGPPVAMAGE